MKTIVHVNRNVLASNNKHGKNDPAIIIRRGKKRVYCYEAELAPGVKIFHKQNEPLDCGAKVWLTVDGEVKVIT